VTGYHRATAVYAGFSLSFLRKKLDCGGIVIAEEKTAL
jgi:hypothetical protein